MPTDFSPDFAVLNKTNKAIDDTMPDTGMATVHFRNKNQLSRLIETTSGSLAGIFAIRGGNILLIDTEPSMEITSPAKTRAAQGRGSCKNLIKRLLSLAKELKATFFDVRVKVNVAPHRHGLNRNRVTSQVHFGGVAAFVLVGVVNDS